MTFLSTISEPYHRFIALSRLMWRCRRLRLSLSLLSQGWTFHHRLRLELKSDQVLSTSSPPFFFTWMDGHTHANTSLFYRFFWLMEYWHLHHHQHPTLTLLIIFVPFLLCVPSHTERLAVEGCFPLRLLTTCLFLPCLIPVFPSHPQFARQAHFPQLSSLFYFYSFFSLISHVS